MNNRIIVTVSAAIGVLVLFASAGCGSSSDATEAPDLSRNPTSVIVGAGSTFVEPLMAAWVNGYQQAHKGMIVNYQGGGSGNGITDFKQGMLQFAASDAPLGDDDVKGLAPILQIPGTAGPVCIIYNLPSAGRLASVQREDPGWDLSRLHHQLARSLHRSGQSWSCIAEGRFDPGTSFGRQRHHEHFDHVSQQDQSGVVLEGRPWSLRDLACRIGRGRQSVRPQHREADPRHNRLP